MDRDVATALQALERAAAFARDYRFELTDAYLALLAQVEALPQNQSGADKGGRWRGGHVYHRSIAATVIGPSKP